jgi:hypothetical protein
MLNTSHNFPGSGIQQNEQRFSWQLTSMRPANNNLKGKIFTHDIYVQININCLSG